MPIVPIDSSADARGAPPLRRRVLPSSTEVTSPGQTLEKSRTYEVGYGRPPKHSRFKTGVSGNPKGRPKGAKGLNTLARELLTGTVPVRTGSGEKKMRRIEAVLHKTFELALKGNPRAQSQILSLYAASVPEALGAETESAADELTTTDLAILEELKAGLLKGLEQ